MPQFVALASDYDGTLAEHGVVTEETIKALENFRQSGRKLILVSGRELPDLQAVFPRADLFDCIVAENGAVLYTPTSREKRVLVPPPKPELINALRKRGVPNVGVGDGIVSTWQPYETIVFETIRDLGLELHVVFNKGAVMVLPADINKKSGLKIALDSMCISPHNVIGVGDAENDHAFLEFCECSTAVANALDSVKQTADFVTTGGHGMGVVELINQILENKIDCSRRRAIPIGAQGGQSVSIPAFGSSLLVGGASGSGKSTFVAGWLETLTEREYQFCLIDPEGDYESFPNTIASGDEKHPPSLDLLLQMLDKPSSEVVVNLMAINVEDRPQFLDQLLPRLIEMRARTGRPHWIIIDEAHHMLSPESTLASAELTERLQNLVLVTVHPDRISPPALKPIDTVLAIGPDPVKVLDAFAIAAGFAEPPSGNAKLAAGEALAWFPRSGHMHQIRFPLSQAERLRHKRNYSKGELGPDVSFYFRGPQNKLNLRAQNLTMFLQLADGIDDETWNYHLERGDYSRWFRDVIKDNALADEARQFERPDSLSTHTSREGIRNAIQQRYTASA